MATGIKRPQLMIRAYGYYSSISESSEFVLCVEPGKRFRAAFYRHRLSEAFDAATPVEAISSVGVDIGRAAFESGPGASSGKPDEDWRWPSIRFAPCGGHWAPGLYAAAVYECDADGLPVDVIGRSALAGEPLPHLESNAAMFVVTPSRPVSPVAYIIPIGTMHAYNFTGGGCLYGYRNPPAERLSMVTMRRPGFGIGGQSREALDCYDLASPRQSFAHWDAKAIGWLRRHGFAPDCYTDLDLDRHDILTGHRLMVSAGHHEYWSQAMRDRVRQFLDGGGNVAIFSGNTCYRRISFGSGCSVTRENEAWPDSNEAELIGVSYSHGGGWWGRWRDGAWHEPERAPSGYRIVAPDHWVFDGVPLCEGGVFGAEDRLLGYECDGVVPGVSPADLQVLAECRLQGGWNNGEGHTAAMVIFESGQGVVFNAATTDWARILGSPHAASYPIVSQITRNVVGRLSSGK